MVSAKTVRSTTRLFAVLAAAGSIALVAWFLFGRLSRASLAVHRRGRAMRRASAMVGTPASKDFRSAQDDHPRANPTETDFDIAGNAGSRDVPYQVYDYSDACFQEKDRNRINMAHSMLAKKTMDLITGETYVRDPVREYTFGEGVIAPSHTQLLIGYNSGIPTDPDYLCPL